MPLVTLEDFAKVAPDEFLRKFQTLWTAQKIELKKLLGKPPDIRRVTSEHWTKWKKDQEAVLLILMVGYISMIMDEQMDQMEERMPYDLRPQRRTQRNINRGPAPDSGTGSTDPEPDIIDREDIEREAIRGIRRRARFASQRIRATTQDRLSKQLRRETGTDTEDFGGFDPETIFSRSRSEMIVRTELTAAKTETTRSIHTSLTAKGVKCQLVWKMRPCDHCEVCPLLDGTPESFWSRFTSGPPLHPHCCCELQILFGSVSELIRTGQMNRNPSVAGLRAAIQRYGFR